MLTFNYISNGYEVTGQVAPLETDIIIPSTFDDGINGEFPVVSIGNYTFQNNSLTSVTIPSSVTSIGNYAFGGNPLTSVTIPNSVESILGAFSGSQLTSVVWETSVGIPSYAFYGANNKITSFTITSDSLVSLANINAFSGVTVESPMTVYVQPQLIEDYKIATNWVTLYNNGKVTFEPIPAPQITKLKPYLTAIKEAIQFKNGTTGNVNVQDMPQMIRDIPSGGGTDVSDTTAVASDVLASEDFYLANGTKATGTILTYSGSTNITENVTLETGGKYLASDIVVNVSGGGGGLEYLMRDSTPAGSKAILTQDGDGTLHAEIPNSVTSIGNSAFRYNQLTSLTIPDSVTSIESFAFANNYSLTSVIIPYSVTSIGTFAFSHNQSLTSVTLQDGVASIGGNAFEYSQLTSVTIPDSVKSIGTNSFSYSQLTSVTIPDGVTSIGTFAFQYNQLTSVVWETTVQIPSSTFAGRDNKITSFTITSDTLISLKNINAFEGVTASQPMTVYVQPQLIGDYKTATNWVTLYNAGKCNFVDIALAPTE